MDWGIDSRDSGGGDDLGALGESVSQRFKRYPHKARDRVIKVTWFGILAFAVILGILEII